MNDRDRDVRKALTDMAGDQANCGQPMTVESAGPGDCSYAKPGDEPICMSNDKRVEMFVQKLGAQVNAHVHNFEEARYLLALMDALPRVLSPQAARGLSYLLRRAGI